MNFKKLLLCSLLAISVAAVPATQAFAQPKTDLVFGGNGADVTQLDPHFATTTTDRTLAAQIYNALVRFAPGSTDPALIEPDLAERWDVSEDNRVWTFYLRPGVKWQKDLGEVSADDVVFSIEKAMNKDTSAFSADYSEFESVEKIDDLTVRVTLKQQIPSLLGVLANYSGGFILPAKAIEPTGSGPFQIDSVIPGQSVHLVAHEDYFRGTPKITSLTHRFLPESAARDLALLSGEVDAAFLIQDKNAVERTKAQDGIAVDVVAPAELALLHLNMNMPPLDDIRVRQALSHAINRDAMAAFRGAEFTSAAVSVIPSNNLGYTDAAGALGYDLDKAKALLAEAGYPDGVTIPVVATQDAGLMAMLQLVQGQFSEAGITLDIQPVEHATWHQMIRQDLSPIVLYNAGRFPVADFYLTQFFYGPSQIGGSAQVTNFSHCDVADAEIEAAKSEPDQAKQIALWEAAQVKILENVCAIPLIESRLIYARKANLDWGYDYQGSMSNGPMVTELTHFTE